MKTFGRAVQGGVEKPATDETVFVAMSATKAITSSALWLLIQEGKIDPADKIVKYVPEYGTNGKETTTIEHLLIHTAGIPDCAGLVQGMGRSQAAAGAFRAVASGESAGRKVLLPHPRELLADCRGDRTDQRANGSASSYVSGSRNRSGCPICGSDCRARSRRGWPTSNGSANRPRKRSIGSSA